MTVIPFDSALSRTREVARAFGYQVFEGPSLHSMDALGSRYWPGGAVSPHLMRKFCAFWTPYERFLFLDADIVVVHPVEPYFDAFIRSGIDLVHWGADIANVYKAGPVRDEMVKTYGAVGFNTGTYLGRHDGLTPEQVERAFARSEAHRHGFADNLEQTFLNYAVDVNGLTKRDAHEIVPSLVGAWAGMRIERRDGALVLADARMAEAGRGVTMIHWAGYHVRPFMPYRRIFLSYRLAGMTRRQSCGYRLRALFEAAGRMSWRTPVRLVKRWKVLGRNVLASRGLIGWP